eukprot:Protomagalhaensia_sp_Gyna_25__525@NODE_1247_length_2026_cov_21_766482_g994_i0_p1_GENE_NODE_1247_length_2026_cov_21_766482_g994_i0NODE_1247_length_2026_cov_21_766482_g994_i0_p1_ORF_typecomplete_len219_score33_73Aldolase_II/PF00596_21/1e43_NODE_1247_length_2026_cov_21_766482_g994_i0134790
MSFSESTKRLACQHVVEASVALENSGLNRGTSGNVSMRWQTNRMLITPSGVPACDLQKESIVEMEGYEIIESELKPSSEWQFHADIYASRPDVNAIVHAHPIYCTAFAMCHKEIPAAHYMIAAAGGPTIRCSQYAPYGTPELSAAVLTALIDRNCCLMGNHGMVALGPSLSKAVWLANELETLAHQYTVALQIGVPKILSDQEIHETMERFKSYGPQK